MKGKILLDNPNFILQNSPSKCPAKHMAIQGYVDRLASVGRDAVTIVYGVQGPI